MRNRPAGDTIETSGEERGRVQGEPQPPPLSLSSPSRSLSASDGRSAARRGSSPPAIRSVERAAGDFTQQLRRNEMICPGAAAKCWMDTYSWDGYRSQL